jgi:hypothetical protein
MLLPVLTLSLFCTVPARSETSSCQELQKRVEQLEEQLQALQSLPPAGRPAAAGRQIVIDDPLIGTWRCTNKVFTYDMTFFADGLLLQESTTFGPMRELSWTRVADDEVLFTGGIKIRTRLSGLDRMTAENLGTRAQWECEKLPN